MNFHCTFSGLGPHFPLFAALAFSSRVQRRDISLHDEERQTRRIPKDKRVCNKPNMDKLNGHTKKPAKILTCRSLGLPRGFKKMKNSYMQENLRHCCSLATQDQSYHFTPQLRELHNSSIRDSPKWGSFSLSPNVDWGLASKYRKLTQREDQPCALQPIPRWSRGQWHSWAHCLYLQEIRDEKET